MELKHRIKGIYGESHLTDKGLADYQAALAKRRAEGRYTLEEAALEIAEHAGERPEVILERLTVAVRDGTLYVYEPGHNARHKSQTIRAWHDEAYWNDLNVWLEREECRIDFVFPDPTQSAEPRIGREAKGITKAEILSVSWPSATGAPPLEKTLKDIPKWAESACIRVGRRGKGAGGSHLWNPATLAVCLATITPQKSWRVSKHALDKFIRSNFADYLSEWESLSEHL
jgi:hypothetical protein